MEETTEVSVCQVFFLYNCFEVRIQIIEYCKKRLYGRPKVHDKLQDCVIYHLTVSQVPVCTAPSTYS